MSGGLTGESMIQQASAHARATWNAIEEVETAHYDEEDPFAASYIRAMIASIHKTVSELVQVRSHPRAHMKAIETLTKALESQSRDLLKHGVERLTHAVPVQETARSSEEKKDRTASYTKKKGQSPQKT